MLGSEITVFWVRVGRQGIYGLRKAIESNPKYNGTIQFESTYPAFVNEDNTFVQVIGAETEGGNRLLYGDWHHLGADGSERLREYFREHIFRDLNC